MATLSRDPLTGSYIVQEGDSLSKIASSQGRTLAELLATNPQYAQNPNLIRPGEVVNINNSNVGSNRPINNETMSFTDALIRILKDAQKKDTSGQAALMAQRNKITGQGITDAAGVFKNKLLTPSSGTSLGRSATGTYDPALLSIADQQSLASKNLSNITDIVEQTRDQYNKEREQELKSSQTPEMTQTEKYRSLLGSYRRGFYSGESLPNGIPILDNNGYITPEAWQSAIMDAQGKGISREDFIAEYGDLLYNGNLIAYRLTPYEQSIIMNLGKTSAANMDEDLY
jgi:LysM repeat protein